MTDKLGYRQISRRDDSYRSFVRQVERLCRKVTRSPKAHACSCCCFSTSVRQRVYMYILSTPQYSSSSSLTASLLLSLTLCLSLFVSWSLSLCISLPLTRSLAPASLPTHISFDIIAYCMISFSSFSFHYHSRDSVCSLACWTSVFVYTLLLPVLQPTPLSSSAAPLPIPFPLRFFPIVFFVSIVLVFIFVWF